MKSKYDIFRNFHGKKEILDKAYYLVNSKKCYLWVKSSEESSPVLSATRLPSA